MNDSYRGTLSSYCYVLMCIHLLQQRQPPILPCLHSIKPPTLFRRAQTPTLVFDAGLCPLTAFQGSQTQHSLVRSLQMDAVTSQGGSMQGSVGIRCDPLGWRLAVHVWSVQQHCCCATQLSA